VNNTKKRFSAADISVVCLVRFVLRHILLVIAAALIGIMLVSVWTSAVHTPQYRATVTYAVMPKYAGYYPGSQLAAVGEDTHAVLSELLGTAIVRKSMAKQDPSLWGMSYSLSARLISESNFIVITSQAESSEAAFRSLKALTEVIPTIGEYFSGNAVLMQIRNPSASSSPVNSVNTQRYSFFAALLCAAGVIYLLCRIAIARETIQTRDGAHHLLDAPIVGILRHEKRPFRLRLPGKKKKAAKAVQVFSPTTGFAYVEQVNAICARLETEAQQNHRKVLLITGVGENEGKTTVSGNIASALAMRGNTVALIDADLRKPSLNFFFDRKYQAELPLNRLLAGRITNDTLLKCIRRHDKLGLYMLFPLKSDARATELITGDAMTELIEKLRHTMDYVIIDSPPMGICPDALALADMADASVLVVRQDYTPAIDLNEATDELRDTKATFLGCILNDMIDAIPGSYEYKKKYGYDYHRYGYGGYSHNHQNEGEED
jgi:capsular exopolysaccharide synthesis family protein